SDEESPPGAVRFLTPLSTDGAVPPRETPPDFPIRKKEQVMDWEAKRRRKQDVADRAAYKDSMYSYCRVIGCGRMPTAAAGKGLDRLYCRKHADHFERHGSYF